MIFKPQSDWQLNDWLAALESRHEAKRSKAERFAEYQSFAVNLGLKPFDAKTIVITGTNGKGSVAACLEALALASGLRVAMVTSPHLYRFNERLHINGVEAEDALWINAFKAIYALDDQTILGYSHYAYLAAFLIIQSQSFDLVVIEAGIGGRFDSARLFPNDLSIITTVGLDHCDVLGNTREAIGYEKVGIVEPNTSLIYGDLDVLDSVKQVTHDRNVSLLQLGQAFSFVDEGYTWSYTSKNYHFDSLKKPHQILLSNAAMAIRGFEAFFDVSNEMINRAMDVLYHPGRCEWQVNGQHDELYDVAHNPQAVEHLADLIATKHDKYERVIAVCGIASNKDIHAILDIMKPYVDQWCFCTLPFRGVGKEQWLQFTEHVGILEYEIYVSPENAYEAALTIVNDNDLVVVFGSFMTVSAIKNLQSI